MTSLSRVLWIGLMMLMPMETGLAQEASIADDPRFAVAVESYGSGQYDAALKLFAELAESEPDLARRAVLHANAGTAAARAEDWGESIWHLEAAWRIDPGDARVRRNLEQVRALSGASGGETSAFLETLRRLPLSMTEAGVSRLVGLLAALAILLLTASRAGWAGRRTVWAAFVVGVAAVGLALGSDAARAWDDRRAVVVEGVAVRAEPTLEGRVLFRLPAGAVVQDEERRDDWRLIETSGGARGWAPILQVRAAGS